MSASRGQGKIEEPGSVHSPEWAAQLTAYVDAQLNSVERSRVEQHLQDCAECQAEVEITRKLKAVLIQLPEVKAPRSFAITPAQARKLRPRPLYTAARVALAMAAALLIFVFALDFSGVTASPAPSVATNIATPTTVAPTLPPIGTLPTCAPSSGGSVSCLSGGAEIPYTATAVKPAPKPQPVPAPQTGAAIHVVEIGLALLVVLLVLLVIASRPRLSTKLRL